MSTISAVFARQTFDSRGNPTVEVDVTTSKGTFRASVPSGISTGAHEAVELRDGGRDYMGRGVSKAVNNVNKTIGPALINAKIQVTDQKAIDSFLIDLDGTANKSKLGANAILGVSLAVAKAGAAERNLPLYAHFAEISESNKNRFVLPVPSFNVINGGVHSGNRLAFQEFLILPTGAKSFREAMKMGTETYHNLRSVIEKKYGPDATNVGDEGGFTPNIETPEEALDLLVNAIDKAGYSGKVKIGLDSAASEFYRDGKYDLDFKNPNSNKSRWLTAEQLTDLYHKLVKKYPIVFIEDPFNQDDWDAFSHLTSKADYEVLGDDLLVTNPSRINIGISKKAVNGLSLKVNQIGTITESIRACKMAQTNNWGVLVSHRSGETEDTSIADLAVGFRTGHIKSGAPSRSERLAKYNQLLRIEEQLGEGNSIYAGENFRTAYKL